MAARIACLLVPDLPLRAELRSHPELAGLPLVIASGPDASHARVCAWHWARMLPGASGSQVAGTKSSQTPFSSRKPSTQAPHAAISC